MAEIIAAFSRVQVADWGSPVVRRHEGPRGLGYYAAARQETETVNSYRENPGRLLLCRGVATAGLVVKGPLNSKAAMRSRNVTIQTENASI